MNNKTAKPKNLNTEMPTGREGGIVTQVETAAAATASAVSLRDCPTCKTPMVLPSRQDLAGLELHQIAAAPGVNCSVSAISRIFSGNSTRLVQLRRMKRIAEFMQITLDELYDIVTSARQSA